MKARIIALGIPVLMEDPWFVKASHFRFGLGFEVVLITDDREVTYHNVSEVVSNGDGAIHLTSYKGSELILVDDIRSLKVNKSREGNGRFTTVKELNSLSI